jgi:hypothetical protein
MAQVAEQIQPPPAEDGYARSFDVHTRVRGDGRAIAVAKFRELADKLESGELDGARVQWLDTHGFDVETVVDGETKRVTLDPEKYTEEEALALAREGKVQPVSGLAYVTRTAWAANGSGKAQLVQATIEEAGR